MKTGRISQSEPNMQTITPKTEEFQRIRRAFISCPQCAQYPTDCECDPRPTYPSSFGPGGEVSIDWLAYNHRRDK